MRMIDTILEYLKNTFIIIGMIYIIGMALLMMFETLQNVIEDYQRKRELSKRIREWRNRE
jgi:succinate dehydrogenase hydrophobic anchor subunit